MSAGLLIDTHASSRVLARMLRSQPEPTVRGAHTSGADASGADASGADASGADASGTVLPESVLWHAYCELRRRGEGDASRAFVRCVKHLHRRRSLGGAYLPTIDTATDEHKLIDDPMVAELWKAYKRCICAQRTGPAAQLLRDIESRL